MPYTICKHAREQYIWQILEDFFIRKSASSQKHKPFSSLTRALILKERKVEDQIGTKYWNTENFQLFSVLVIIMSSTNSTVLVQI